MDGGNIECVKDESKDVECDTKNSGGFNSFTDTFKEIKPEKAKMENDEIRESDLLCQLLSEYGVSTTTHEEKLEEIQKNLKIINDEKI